MATVRLVADMPDAQLENFLQLLRGWDQKKDDRHLQIAIEASAIPAAEMLAMFQRLQPMFDDSWYMPVPKRGGTDN